MDNNDLIKIPFVSQEKIANISTYKTQGTVKGVFYPRNEEELILVYNFLSKQDIPFKIIGNGSNLLIKDDCDFLFICTKKMKDKIRFCKNEVHFSSSVTLAKAYNLSLKKSLSGFQRLAGIPATLGGAIRNNASAFGQSVFDNLDKIKIFKDGKIKFLKKSDIIYSYHRTNLKDCLILSAKFILKPASWCEICNEFGLYSKIRSEKQPKGFSCGSVFKNPAEASAGQLIEDCKLKGKHSGNAKISEKHGNFIINTENASFYDVKSLIELCQQEVLKKYNINLEKEVEIIE